MFLSDRAQASLGKTNEKQMNRLMAGIDTRPIRILIADDSAPVRSSLSALLARVPGTEVVAVAQNGREALELIRTHVPDVITLDIRMPELTGLAVLEILQKERISAIIIILTGLAEEEYRQRCLELGASHFFHKATEFEKVIEILNDQVHRRQTCAT